MVSNFKTDASLVDVVNEKDGMPIKSRIQFHFTLVEKHLKNKASHLVTK